MLIDLKMCFYVLIWIMFLLEINLNDKCLDGVLNNNTYESDVLKVRPFFVLYAHLKKCFAHQ